MGAYEELLANQHSERMNEHDEEKALFLSPKFMDVLQPHVKLNKKRIKATFYLERNNPKVAIIAYKELIQLKKDNPSAHHNMACCYHVLGQVKEAEVHFVKALSKGTSGIHCEYGLFLVIQKRYKEALIHLKLSLEKKEDDSGLSYGLMEKPLLDKNLQQEIGEEKSFAIKPVYLAYYLLVQSYLALNDKAQGEHTLGTFTKQVEAQPTPLLYRLLSYAYQQTGNEQVAQQYRAQSTQLKAQEEKQKVQEEGESKSVSTLINTLGVLSMTAQKKAAPTKALTHTTDNTPLESGIFKLSKAVRWQSQKSVAVVFDTPEKAKAFCRGIEDYGIKEKSIYQTEDFEPVCFLTLDEYTQLQKAGAKAASLTATSKSKKSDTEDSDASSEDGYESEEDEDYKRALAMSLGR